MSVMMFDHIFFLLLYNFGDLMIVYRQNISKRSDRKKKCFSWRYLVGGRREKKEKIWHGRRKSWWWGVVGVVMEDLAAISLFFFFQYNFDSCLNNWENENRRQMSNIKMMIFI